VRTRGIVVAVSLALLLSASVVGSAASSSGTAPTALPTLSTFYAMAVDGVHDQVFLSGGPGSSFLQVHNFGGSQVAVVGNQSGASDLELSADSSKLYVALPTAHAVSVIDTATLGEVHRYSLGTTVCPEELAIVGTRIVFSTRCAAIHSFGWVDTANGSIQTGLRPSSQPIRYLLEPVIGSADQLLIVPRTVSSSAPMFRMRVAETTMTVLATGPVSANVSDLAVVDPDLFVVTMNSSSFGHRFFRVTDLTIHPRHMTIGGPMNAAAATSDGFVAAGFLGSQPYHGDFAVFGPDNSNTRRTIDFPAPFVDVSPQERAATRGLAWSPDGTRLFGVTVNQTGRNPKLHPLADPRKIDSGIGINLPWSFGQFGEQVVFDISVGPTYFSPLPTGSLLVTRTDRLGTQTIASPPVSAALGVPYPITDLPRTTGQQIYTISYAGDALYLPRSKWEDTNVVAAGADLTGDLIEDLSIGVPDENYGAVPNSGAAAVLPGGPGGVTGARGIGFVGSADDYDTGGREAADRFGFATALGDFDGNGFADLAVSGPSETDGFIHQGAVRIYWADKRAGHIAYHDTRLGSRPNQRLGYALASGDFDGNNFSDLVIGARDERVRVTGTHGRTLSQNSTGVPGTMRSGERHGTVFAVGDLNGDGFQDLAVGAPGDRDDRGYASGSVTVHYGSAGGLRASGSQRWSKASPGVPGSPSAGNTAAGNLNDGFGSALAIGDFNGDGFGDLAVGAPGSRVGFGAGTVQDAGTVTVLFGSASRLSAAGSRQLTEASPGVPANPANDDRFGIALASGDANGDGRSELAIGVARRQVVVVLAGTVSGFGSTGISSWSQNTTGIPDSTESGDGWGSDLRFGHYRSAAHADLVVSARGENGGSGAVTLIYGSPAGLTAIGATRITQGTVGVPDTPEPGDHFGYLD